MFTGTAQLPEFMARSEIVVCLLPLTGETRDLFNARTLAATLAHVKPLHLLCCATIALGSTFGGWAASPGPLPPAADQSLARAIFKELIEADSTFKPPTPAAVCRNVCLNPRPWRYRQAAAGIPAASRRVLTPGLGTLTHPRELSEPKRREPALPARWFLAQRVIRARGPGLMPIRRSLLPMRQHLRDDFRRHMPVDFA